MADQASPGSDVGAGHQSGAGFAADRAVVAESRFTKLRGHQHRNCRAGDRRGTAAARCLRHAGVNRRHYAVHRVSLPVLLCRRRDCRDVP